MPMAKLRNIPILGKIVGLFSTIVLVVVLSSLIGLILAFPVMWLWNFVFGAVYRLNVFQAWALNVLTGILFGHAANRKQNNSEEE